MKFIVCGSYVDTMKALLEKQNPLYGRIDLTLNLKPMDSDVFYDRYIVEDFEKIGKYYYDDPIEKRNGEFDIVILDDRGYIFYEAKFKKEPVTESVVQNEIHQVEQTGLECYKYGFFSKSGFACEEEENRILIELKELYK